MIGTNWPYRPQIAFVLFAVTCTGVALMGGCRDVPMDIVEHGRRASLDEIAVVKSDKPDVATTSGTVEAIDGTSMRLRVAGQWFYADNETEIDRDGCEPCAFAGIEVGDPAKVKHDRVPGPDGAYYAREIEIVRDEDNEGPEDPEDDETETEGSVETLDGDRLRVDGVWFWLDELTELEFDDDCASTVIVPGDRVKIEHSTAVTEGLGFYAYKIEIKRDCEEGEREGMESF